MQRGLIARNMRSEEWMSIWALTNANGHGEGRDENMNMVETIKNLQKDV